MTTGAKGDRTDTATGEASPRRRPGGARPNGPLLELTQIVDVAAELTAEQGLDRVSMRQLGERLGVTSMAIYWYVENRAALIDALLERVWGYGYFGDGRLVDVHVRRLRTKIEADPANPRHVVTVRGLGYKLQT